MTEKYAQHVTLLLANFIHDEHSSLLNETIKYAVITA